MRRPPSRRFTPSGHSRTRTRWRRSRHATRSSAVAGGKRRRLPSARLPSAAPRRRSPRSPAREWLGDLLLELGRPVEAAQAYAASLAQQPNRARSLFGLARASEQAGDLATARTRYREYLALMQQGDGARAELEIARGALSGR